MNAFYVVGGLFTLWAVVVAALGIRRPTFPGRAGARIVGLVSVVLAVAAVAAASITASAEEEGEATEGAGEEGAGALRVRADRGGALRFDRDRLEAPAGRVTISMANPARIRHNVAIDGNGVEAIGPVAGPNGTSSVTADLPPGTYDFYCSILGHRAGGMGGTLTVR